MEPARSPGDRPARSGTPKTVSIADVDSISPLMKGKCKSAEPCEEPLDLDRCTQKQFSAGLGSRRLQGRASVEPLCLQPKAISSAADQQSPPEAGSRPHSHHGYHDGLVAQIAAWIKQEKQRRTARKVKTAASKEAAQDAKTATADAKVSEQDETARRPSDASEGSAALEALSAILERNASLQNDRGAGSKILQHVRRLSSYAKIHRQSTSQQSDTEDTTFDVNIPHAEAILDNSKTLAYSGGIAEESDGTTTPGKTACKDREAWSIFKYEILRITHTLGLKGWRKLSLESSGDIDVERLSGALTNAVYFVKPPKNLPSQDPKFDAQGNMIPPKKPLPNLLLRIYGPQVEHLIDREAELQILRRMRRKNIGPKLLGTFTNGRFEEFLHSRTLTAEDLRVPETSKQISKRMRELHEGMELTEQEKEDGPFVWKNWDKWTDRAEQIVTWLDEHSQKNKDLHQPDCWRQCGHVLGTDWQTFRKTVEKYRKWLVNQYGGDRKIRERMVFAHNDTQYGNILRLIPPGESPLLLPSNEHKQLVVIDFEYANANLPGYEFANHFIEWCYNYHDPDHPHSVNVALYPSPEEQHRFLKAYIQHRPSFSSNTSPPTPSLGPINLSAFPTPSSSISAFMLDSRAPQSVVKEQLDSEDAQIEGEVQRLMAETRIWRMASSSHWIAWGVVQAKIPGLPEFSEPSKDSKLPQDANATDSEESEETMKLQDKEEKQQQKPMSDPLDADARAAAEDIAAKRPDDYAKPEEEKGEEDMEEEEEEFDYLSYAYERALFFWGDAVRLGFIGREELPENIRDKIRLVEY